MGRNSVDSISVKMAVLAPMPSASDRHRHSRESRATAEAANGVADIAADTLEHALFVSPLFVSEGHYGIDMHRAERGNQTAQSGGQNQRRRSDHQRDRIRG